MIMTSYTITKKVISYSTRHTKSKMFRPIKSNRTIFSNVLGFQRIRHASTSLLNERIGIVGVPFEKGQRRVGVGLGPDRIREGGLTKRLQAISNKIHVTDYGNIEYLPADLQGRTAENMNKLTHFVACTEILSNTIQHMYDKNNMCITLGGDHSIAVGSIDGHLKASKKEGDNGVGVIWVDAHADLNTNATSQTGNIHGMPVALVLKELAAYWPYIPGMDWQHPDITCNNLAYIALRDVDAFEKLILEKFKITAYGMREIAVYGIKEIVAKALRKVDPLHSKRLHISFDIDALDTLEAPSTGTAVRGGLTLREGIYIMEQIQRSGRLKGVDLVEVNPSIGNEEDVYKTVEAAIHLLQAACGHNRTGNLPDEDEIPRYLD